MRRKERLISGWMGERNGSAQLKLPWNYSPVNRGHVLRSDTSKEAAARYQPCFSRFSPLCTPTFADARSCFTTATALFFCEENNYSGISVS